MIGGHEGDPADTTGRLTAWIVTCVDPGAGTTRRVRQEPLMGPSVSEEAEIESELSLAYVHAVAAAANLAFAVTTRREDNWGIDARLTRKVRELAPDEVYRKVFLDIQVKATRRPPRVSGRGWRSSWIE